MLLTVCCLAGLTGLIGWLAGRAQATGANVLADERGKEVVRLSAELSVRSVREQELIERQQVVERDRDRLTTILDKERETAATHNVLLEHAELKLREAFAVTSQQALKANSESFLDLAKALLGELQQAATGDLDQRQKSIDDLVKPVQEGLAKVEIVLQTVDRQRAESHATLQETLRQIVEAHQQLSGNTQSLVQALRAPPRARTVG